MMLDRNHAQRGGIEMLMKLFNMQNARSRLKIAHCYAIFLSPSGDLGIGLV